MISDIEKDINTGEEYFWIKIIDFGTAKIFERKKKEKEIIGSSYYIAPEVLKKNYNEKCDTWSVGVILYMTLTGVPPFDGEQDEDIIERIKIGKFSKTSKRYLEHSPEVKDLVNSLLERDINTISKFLIDYLINYYPTVFAERKIEIKNNFPKINPNLFIAKKKIPLVS
jgi:serine/threonine protein kinase